MHSCIANWIQIQGDYTMFLNANRLKNITKQNFGEYLEFIESSVYQMESAFERYKRLTNKQKNMRWVGRMVLGFFFMAFWGFPLILTALAISHDVLDIKNGMIYSTWFIGGSWFFRKAVKKYWAKAKIIKQELADLKLTMGVVISYAIEVNDSFFEKNTEVTSATIINLTEDEKIIVEKEVVKD